MAQIAAAARSGPEGAFDILLAPEELGRVRLTLTPAEGSLMVSVLAERGETLEMLRRSIALLESELRDLGYDNPSFSFGSQTDGDRPPGRDRPSASVPESAATLAEALRPAPTPTTAGLDLRL